MANKESTQNCVQIRVNETTWGRIMNDHQLGNMTAARVVEALAWLWFTADVSHRKTALDRARTNLHRQPMRNRIHADTRMAMAKQTTSPAPAGTGGNSPAAP